MLILALIACKSTRSPGGDDDATTDTGSESSSDSSSNADSAPPAGDPSAVQFYGNGKNNVDRARVALDPSGSSSSIDVGDDDFTAEFWIQGASGDNRSTALTCASDDVWNRGNVVLDATRQGADGWGVSVAGGFVVFHVTRAGETRLVCGGRDVLDEAWHHVAVGRRASDGQMWLFSDGLIEGVAYGPSGDLSYPDGTAPAETCGPQADLTCENDRVLVIGAEKHDSGPPFPSFAGTIDELRVSSTLRYTEPFDVKTHALVADEDTVALFHFDEATGESAEDETGGEPAEFLSGGTPPGPEWVAESPFE